MTSRKRTLIDVLTDDSISEDARLVYCVIVSAEVDQIRRDGARVQRRYLLDVLGRHGDEETLRNVLAELERHGLATTNAGQTTVFLEALEACKNG